MLAQIKNNMKQLPKILGIALILFLFSLNIQIMFSDNQSGEADLSLFGLKVNLFESTYAQAESANCSAKKSCSGGGEVSCQGTSRCRVFVNCVYCDDVEACCS